jgi:transcription initiation factor TFIID subunit 1
MVRLHGPGDPSGCGLAFSFIKTSMKGGYLEGIQQGPHSSKAARAAMDAKANGGHGYNVKTQQDFYNAAIREIWGKQKENLTDPVVHEHDDRDDEDSNPQTAATPATHDDNASVFSANEYGGKVLRITRIKKNQYGQDYEDIEIVKDPRVWRQYEKRKAEQMAQSTK